MLALSVVNIAQVCNIVGTPSEGSSVAELKRTPLYEEHVALGARMVPFAGWEMPVQYEGIIEEHKDVRSLAGVFDVSHMAEFRVFGFGALDFLQRMFTNDPTPPRSVASMRPAPRAIPTCAGGASASSTVRIADPL